MVGEVADWVTVLRGLLAPDARLLAVAVAVDLIAGDPVYAAHPVRLIGRSLGWLEARLRNAGADGYVGGVALFVCLALLAQAVVSALLLAARSLSPALAGMVHGFFLYSFLALGDLVRHVWRIERALRANDRVAARTAVRALVGRDTDQMDDGACRRAGVESLSENLTDGYISAIFWYALGGLAGLVVFKVVSTMDSMVGYKTPRYLRFGWCGARLDDVMNYLPARLAWILIAGVAALLPGCSGRKAWMVGLRQHAILLGPNSGWSEAATAGALQRRLVGPIWLRGALVTDVWIGAESDPPLATAADVGRAVILVVAVGLSCVALAVAWFATGR
jgi:adenosylcobinamide-phosphate synthase